MSHAELSLSFAQWSDKVFNRLEFDLILLHPTLFLSRSQLLLALKSRDPLTYAHWKIIDRDLREEDSMPDSEPYPSFSYTSRNKSLDDFVNPFLLILNAGLKLQRHQTKYGFVMLTNRQKELASLTHEAYDLIYYHPQNFTDRHTMVVTITVPNVPQLSALAETTGPAPRANNDSGVAFESGARTEPMAVDERDEDNGEGKDSGLDNNTEELT